MFQFFIRMGEAIAQSSTMGFLILFGIAVVAFGITSANAFRYLIKARTLEDMPTSKARSAEQGYIELEGHAELLEGPPILAPLSHRECVWWSYTIQEQVNDKWKVVKKEVSDSLFSLVDATGKCIVDPEGAQVFSQHKRVWNSHELLKARVRGIAFTAKQRYTEHYLFAHELLTVIGFYRTHTAVDDWNDADEIRTLLGNWKKDQPVLLARFDTDHDGRIDQQEWQRARDAARRQINQEKRELAVRPGVNVIGAPRDQRPFLIAPYKNREFAQKLRWKAIWSSCGMLASGAYLVFVLVSRFNL